MVRHKTDTSVKMDENSGTRDWNASPDVWMSTGARLDRFTVKRATEEELPRIEIIVYLPVPRSQMENDLGVIKVVEVNANLVGTQKIDPTCFFNQGSIGRS